MGLPGKLEKQLAAIDVCQLSRTSQPEVLSGPVSIEESVPDLTAHPK